MELTFLGTASMVPTKERNASSIFLKLENDGLLFDCGEGTQRQMNIAGINRNLVTIVLISHWHGDHVAGLVGLIQTLGNIPATKKIKLFGPVGTENHFNHLLRMCAFDSKVDVELKELKPKMGEELKFLDKKTFSMTAVKLDHSTPCIGYSFYVKDKRRVHKKKMEDMKIREGPHLQKLVEGHSITYQGKKIKPEDVTYVVKGKKIALIMDTRECVGCDVLAKDADVLISEATHLEEISEKANKYKHLTAQQAARIASRNNVKKLYITHFSQRYKTSEKLDEEAKTIFPETVCAFDFLKIKKF